jgi:DNA polymerase
VTDAGRRQALEVIATEVRACTDCRLHETRTRAVPGEGDPETEVVVVGEGPGEHEDRQGRPFVGASGQFLTELIETIGWRRDDVFITNVVKCRPPGNRDPLPDEIKACSAHLRHQLEVLDPAVVVTVGKFSLTSFRPGERISQAHGTTAPADPATGARDALVFAMYHPAFALYQSSNRQTLLNDVGLVPAALIEARRRRESTATIAAANVKTRIHEQVTSALPTDAAPPPAAGSLPTDAAPPPAAGSPMSPADDDALSQLTLFQP